MRTIFFMLLMQSNAILKVLVVPFWLKLLNIFQLHVVAISFKDILRVTCYQSEGTISKSFCLR